MKKRICALLLGICILLTLAACSTAGTENETEAQKPTSGANDAAPAEKADDTAKTGEPVTITYYTWETSEQSNPVWDEILENTTLKSMFASCLTRAARTRKAHWISLR